MNPSIWRSNVESGDENEPSTYFYGAPGTGFNSTASSSSSSTAFSGPRVGKQTSWPVPRASSSIYAVKTPSIPNYAAIAHRAMTAEDHQKACAEDLKQEESARQKEAQQKQNFMLRTQSSAATICRFYAMGTCKYGQQCRYIHGSDEQGMSGEGFNIAQDRIEYEYIGVLRERLGEVSELSATQKSEPALSGVETEQILTSNSDNQQFEEATDCGICMSCTPQDKLYGILSHCNCVFCLSCIKEWRAEGAVKNPGMSSSTLRQCPLCRVPSFFVVPSIRTFTLKASDLGASIPSTEGGLSTGEARKAQQAYLQAQKYEFIDIYKKSLKQKPCRYYLQDKTCQFGSSCFYLHIDASGVIERNPKDDLDSSTKPRYLLNAAGETIKYVRTL